MIYTLTLNPSVDYIVAVDNMELGGLNRTTSETKFPGGKGINVSRVLKRLDINSKALGFIGGFTGDYIEKYLQSEGIETKFIRVSEDTRINVKLKSNQETEINGSGPCISKDAFLDLINQISHLSQEDLLVLAGSIPSTLPSNTYEEIVKICNENGVRFVVDAEGDLLKKVLSHNPFLIKPNHHELGQLFGTTVSSCEDALTFGKQLVEMGAENVIVSLADKGAVFVNKDVQIISNVPKGEMKSSVGAGDSMVAGFLSAYERTKDVKESFRYSVASGSATAFSIGLCNRDLVEQLLTQVNFQEERE
ncbi:1-phosphofructokinase [Cytobacillus sp. FJAT-54145]|uniref:Tagatose-6-phosphate kinase n=1 Tax=Cytobacillus spartinae TaxID=3299023 RepID=A0ABW6KIN5_9BACI